MNVAYVKLAFYVALFFTKTQVPYRGGWRTQSMFTNGETGLLLARWLASLGDIFFLPALKFQLKYLSLHLSG